MKNMKSARLPAPWSYRERKFLEEYIVDLNIEAAAARAQVDYTQARIWLGTVKFQHELARETSRRQYRTSIYGDELVRRLWQVATADARELTQVRYVNCRYCWGIDHQYQFRDHELREATARHLREQLKLSEEDRVPFDELGGGGFHGERDPCRGPDWELRQLQSGADPPSVAAMVNSDHDCPACDGVGVRTVWVADSRTLSPSAAALFNGVSVSKDGFVEVKVRDRDRAMTQLGRWLGMEVHRTVNANLDFTQLTEEQLERAIEQFSRLEARTVEHE